MSKQAMRDETERLVKKALERKIIARNAPKSDNAHVEFRQALAGTGFNSYIRLSSFGRTAWPRREQRA
jgi:hypothetical protein